MARTQLSLCSSLMHWSSRPGSSQLFIWVVLSQRFICSASWQFCPSENLVGLLGQPSSGGGVNTLDVHIGARCGWSPSDPLIIRMCFCAPAAAWTPGKIPARPSKIDRMDTPKPMVQRGRNRKKPRRFMKDLLDYSMISPCHDRIAPAGNSRIDSVIKSVIRARQTGGPRTWGFRHAGTE
jgi:hypothetical protein